MNLPYFSTLLALLVAHASCSYLDAVGNSVTEPSVEGQDVLSWCTKSVLEQQKCEKLAAAVLLDKGLFGRDFIEIKCKQAFDTEECMTWVDRGEASLVALDAGDVYVAGRFHSLVPIVQELYGRGESYQYSVAVINKGGLPQVQGSLHALRGVRACFPGVGALAGWVMPIHVLMQEGGLKVTDCNNHVKSAISYFGDSCAPNSLKDMYNPIGDNSDQLCRLCAGGAGIRCTLQDPYAGYEGALRCLVANASGEIAFVKDTTIQHALLSRRILGGITEDHFELLCRDGSRRPVNQWEGCNWGRVPADALVTSSAASLRQRERYQNILKKLITLYGEPNSLNKNSNRTSDYQSRLYDQYGNVQSTTEFNRFAYDPFKRNDIQQSGYNRQEYEVDMNGVSTAAPFKMRVDGNGKPIELPFKLFESNGTTDLLLQDATINFRILKEDEQSAKHILNNQYVGNQAERAVTGIRDCPVKRAVLCVTSDPEMDKCIKMRVALKAAYLSPTLVCWRGHSARHCARAIADGASDFALLDPADMLHAAAAHRLAPFMQEVYSSGDNWYYAVAVAKEQDPDTDVTYLRGKRSCHTGIGHAAGWLYPLAYMISNGWIRSYGCDGAHAASQYFSKSCAPGALSSEYVDSNSVPHENLCHLCHGASFRRCRRDASEPYYGHLGAVRCMVEGGGDVAFVRHTAPAEASGGRRREWWARDLLPDDLQLLCADGTRAKMHEYKTCNLGKVPGSVLMGRPNHTELDTYSNLMVYTQQLYGASRTDDFSFSMFYSPPPYSDLIFSDAAVRLMPLPHSQRSADIVAGTALIRAARIVSCDAPQASYYIASDPDFLSGAYKTGVVGHLIAVALFCVAFVR
ncbi:melanotransferrin isoform X2 [Plutella xylostella]|uniref:melanotransferrin isoform X1 n=1 Tax=Plutella xylostella TaxID=51655 RepID=UPI0020322D2B|nr:melanotransferrin isoform X1 [Plutella xylostella]XP_048486500.1 melanotransferrin isoform X2 [Plutella xylostella]